jgi:carbamate kinase
MRRRGTRRERVRPRREALSVEGSAGSRASARRARPVPRAGVELLVVHGNGLQVGHQPDRAERARARPTRSRSMSVSRTQGELGYVLAQALGALLVERGFGARWSRVVTQVEVDGDDPGFAKPSKPIGPVYAREAGERLATQRGWTLAPDGAGVRRCVPSPEPRRILELASIRHLLGAGVLVVGAGGGGIPVIGSGDVLAGAEAVVDKDLSAALLAHALGADALLLLSDVPCAYTDHFGPRQEPIGRVACSRARALQAEGHFAPGSMGPKIEAAVRFVAGGDRRAIVCDPPSLAAALWGEAGTIVVPGCGTRCPCGASSWGRRGGTSTTSRPSSARTPTSACSPSPLRRSRSSSGESSRGSSPGQGTTQTCRSIPRRTSHASSATSTSISCSSHTATSRTRR